MGISSPSRLMAEIEIGVLQRPVPGPSLRFVISVSRYQREASMQAPAAGVRYNSTGVFDGIAL
jgi:hypothetical protein